MSANLEQRNLSSARAADLADALERHGVNLPALTQWRTLRGSLSDLRQEPQLPGELLDLTPDQIHEYAYRRALHLIATNEPRIGYRDQLGFLYQPLDVALIDSIRAAGSNIIAQLRVPFDAAADIMRAAHSLGVRPESTFETLFAASDEARAAWLKTREAAAQLDAILDTRQLLSMVAHVAPSPSRATRVQMAAGHPSGISWSATIARDARLDPQDPKAPQARWLRIAPALHLADPELNPTTA